MWLAMLIGVIMGSGSMMVGVFLGAALMERKIQQDESEIEWR